MRRWMVAALPALLVLLLVAGPAAALADDAPSTVVLAVEDGEPLGPEPQPREQEGNSAGEIYADQETPFTWGAAWILTFAGVVGFTLLVGLYWLLVRRPSRESAGSR